MNGRPIRSHRRSPGATEISAGGQVSGGRLTALAAYLAGATPRAAEKKGERARALDQTLAQS